MGVEVPESSAALNRVFCNFCALFCPSSCKSWRFCHWVRKRDERAKPLRTRFSSRDFRLSCAFLLIVRPRICDVMTGGRSPPSHQKMWPSSSSGIVTCLSVFDPDKEPGRRGAAGGPVLSSLLVLLACSSPGPSRAAPGFAFWAVPCLLTYPPPWLFRGNTPFGTRN